MSEHDKTIGANIRRLREARDISQAYLATRMQQLGWNWTQPIVASIEKGGRSLKLAEAVALCSISVLDVDDPGDLLGAPLVDLWWASASGLDRSAKAMRAATNHFWEAQLQMARISDEILASGGVIPEMDDGSMWLMQADVAEVIENLKLLSVPASSPGKYEKALFDGPLHEHVRGSRGATSDTAE